MQKKKELKQEAVRGGRLEFLDSARGLAAWIVLLYHCIQYFNMNIMTLETRVIVPLKIVFNGTQAVSFFFVLSGFVLTASLRDLSGDFDYANYLAKRVLRIYPLYLFAVWTAFFLTPAAGIFTLVQESIIILPHHNMLPPGWTMGVEVILSFLMPVVVIVQRDRRMFYLLMGVVLLSYRYMNPFTFHFMLGAALYDAYRSGYRPAWLLRTGTLLVLVPVCLVLYSWREIAPVVPALMRKVNVILQFISMPEDTLTFYFSGLASGVFIFLLLCADRVQRWLNHGFLTFIGKISFSLYLLHWLFLEAVGYRDYGIRYVPHNMAGLAGLMIFISAVTIAASYLSYRFIELPFMRLGKRVDLRHLLGARTKGI
ncbi:MAG: acyltransferase [Bacteroidetes bacterium]|nr:acyltransferase [Bacteroidota bacterium]